jgi:hypothetical protein
MLDTNTASFVIRRRPLEVTNNLPEFRRVDGLVLEDWLPSSAA